MGQPCVTAGVAYDKDPMLLQGFKPLAKAQISVMSPYEYIFLNCDIKQYTLSINKDQIVNLI